MKLGVGLLTALSIKNNVQANAIFDIEDDSVLMDVPGHYKIADPDNHLQDSATSALGCLYEDLPTEYQVDADTGPISQRVFGQWQCRTRYNRNGKAVDMCQLSCDVGYGLKTDHLMNNGEKVDKFNIKSKRLVCKRNKETRQMEWTPALNGNVFPRCHRTCGDLDLHNVGENDSKAFLECRNFGAIEEKYCQPGVNCHHMATCWARCEDGFGKQNTPKDSNEMECICTQKKCGWKIPDDIGNLGQCEFKMLSKNQRIIGGWTVADQKDQEEAKHQVTFGSEITENKETNKQGRKKRAAGENLIDHRRKKRQAMTKRWQHVCGGVLLTGNWAVTAAHCKTPGIVAVLGELDFADKEGTEVRCRIRAQIQHPHYDGMTYNDIMMMNLACKKLKMGEEIYPASLPMPNNFVLPVGQDLTVCGWGTMKYPEYVAAVELQCVNLNMMDRDTCNIPYGGAIHDRIICLGELGVGGRDSCQGDSGGGAFYDGVCVGLVMGGLYCADESYPGVYTVLSNYVPWLVDVVKAWYSAMKNASKSKGKGKKGRRRGRRSLITPPQIRQVYHQNNFSGKHWQVLN